MHLLTDIIRNGLANHPKKKILAIRPKYRTISWNYEDLFVFSQDIGKFLHNRGVQKGDRVILWATNSPYWMGVFFGCLSRGVIVVPLHSENTPEFIQKVIDQTQPKVFFKSSNLNLSLDNVDWIDIDDNNFHSKAALAPVNITENDIVEILFTSGTTDEPKGVILTHKNIVSNINSIWNLITVKKSDRFLSILPLNHIFEQMVEFRVLSAHAFTVYASSLSSSIIRGILKEYKINKMAVVPEFLKRIISHIESEAKRMGKAKFLAFLFSYVQLIPIRKIRRIAFFSVHKKFGGKLDMIVSGGATLESKIAKKWQTLGVEIIQGYGLTETSPVLTLLSPGDSRIESVGEVVPDVSVKIAEDGEIIAKGPNVMQGYWKNPGATREAIDPLGWFHTGDLGFFDDKHLYIKGRKKFMILTPSGQNVYPEDIEAELSKNPKVQDSAVVELQREGTALIHAVLLGNIKDPKEIVEEANKNLASFQRIQSWSVWPFVDFPRTMTRKIKRHEVLDYLEEQKNTANLKKKEEEFSVLMQIAGEVLDQSPSSFTADTPLDSVGLDSLARIELISRIEEELGITLDESQITAATSVNDLDKMVIKGSTVKILYKLVSWPRHPITIKIRKVLYGILVVPFFKTFTNLHVRGLDNIEDIKGQVIFMPNHISDLDGVVVSLALPKKMRFNLAVASATDVLFRSFWYVQPLLTFFFNSYPFSRKGQTRTGLEYTGELLDKGWNILVFPGGHISDDPGDSFQLRPGTGLMAVEMQTPIVPVKIIGTNSIMPHGKHLPRRRGDVQVRFGKPLYFYKQTSHIEATKRIQEALENL